MIISRTDGETDANPQLKRTREEWRPVVGYEDRYQVSDRGRVRRVGQRRCLAQSPNWRGYLRVKLYGGAGAKPRNHRVHVLVAAAFVGPRPAGFTVDHVDTDKSNNWATNLEYVTRLENYLRHVRRSRAAAAEQLQRGRARLDIAAQVIEQAVAA